jgi:hypothetical protein
MPTAIKRGDDNPQLQKKTYTYEWTRGGTYAEEWKGINPDKMIAQWNGSIYTAQSAQMSINQGVAEMKIEWSAQPGSGGTGDPGTIQVTTDRWECPEPRAEKPLFEHPLFIAGLYSYGSSSGGAVDDVWLTEQVCAWKKAAESRQKFSDFTAPYQTYWNTFVAANPFYGGLMIRFYRMMANDQTHYQTTQYSCRHTTNAPNYWGLNQADLNVNAIYSPAQFMSEVTNGSLWYFPMPGRMQYKLSTAVSALLATTPSRSNFLIGWLKGASAESTVARGRIEIQTQYVLDQWSTDIYPTV